MHFFFATGGKLNTRMLIKPNVSSGVVDTKNNQLFRYYARMATQHQWQTNERGRVTH